MAIRREVTGLSRPVRPISLVCSSHRQLAYQRPVVNPDSIGPRGAYKLPGGLRVAKTVCGDGHEAVEAAQQKVQFGCVAGPQPPIERRMHAAADTAHLQEEGQ